MIPKFKKSSPNALPAVRVPANVIDHSYDGETKKLTVEFHGGRKYVYDGVSRATLEKFRDAPSKGNFVFEKLTPHHTFKRI